MECVHKCLTHEICNKSHDLCHKSSSFWLTRTRLTTIDIEFANLTGNSMTYKPNIFPQFPLMLFPQTENFPNVDPP